MMRANVVTLLVLVIGLGTFALVSRDAFALDLLFTFLLYAVLGQSWNWISGYAGAISLGHALFYACGAYVAALCSATWHISPWLAFGIALPVAAFLAFVTGFPTLRLRGHYFSIATIAIAALAEIAVRTTPALGGANGFELPIENGFAHLQFAAKNPYVLLALALFAIAQVLTMRLERAKLGYYLRALRANHEAAASVGIVERKWKLIALCGAATLAAAAGVLYAQYTLYVDPGTLSLATSIDIALIGVVGGIGTLWGPAAGAFVFVLLSKFVALELGGTGKGYDLVIYGFLIVVIATLRPAGIVGAFVEGSRARRARELA